jgi:hypothetical protein
LPGAIFGRWGELQVTLQALVEYANQLRQAGVLTEVGFR